MEHERQITAERLAAFSEQLRREERAAGTEENYLRHVRAFAGWLAGEPVTRENYGALMDRIDAYLSEFDQHGTDNINVDLDE